MNLAELNPVIKEQLDALSKSHITEECDNYLIVKKKQVITSEDVEVGDLYLIKVLEPPTESTVTDNWNSGFRIKPGLVRCAIVSKVGKMCKIDGVGYDPLLKEATADTYLGLWISTSSFEVLEVLND